MFKNALCVKLGERIRRLRKKKGMNQPEFAAHLGMNRGHISDLELGKREACLLTLEAIADGLDITMSELLKGL